MNKGKQPAHGTTPGRNGYPDVVWAKLRAMYESGEYNSVEHVREEYNAQTGKRAPAKNNIDLRMQREGWVKHGKKAELLEIETQKWRRLFAEVGVTDVKVVETIAEMIKDKSDRTAGLHLYQDFTGSKAPTKIAKTDAEGFNVPDTVFYIPRNGFEEPDADEPDK
jgi:hypothetical protein